YLAAGCNDRALRVWDVASGDLKREVKDFRLEVQSVAFSPDGGKLAVGVGDGQVRLWEFPKMVENANQPEYWAQQDENGASFFVSFSPDGKTLARCGPDGLKLYPVQEPGSPVLINSPKRVILPGPAGAKPNVK